MIFKLDSSKQEAALETARRKIAEIDAAMLAAEADIIKAEGQIQEAKSAYQQASDELDVKSELQRRNPGIVPQRDIEKLQVLLAGRQGSLDAATASKQSAMTPRERASPRREGKRRGGDGRSAGGSEQDLYSGGNRWARGAVRVARGRYRQSDDAALPAFSFRKASGRQALAAGFGQIEAQVMKVGMVAEATCISKPWTIIPMVVTQVQDYIAAGQFRGGEQLIEARQVVAPGTILALWSRSIKAASTA